jgi:hypothetical protein
MRRAVAGPEFSWPVDKAGLIIRRPPQDYSWRSLLYTRPAVAPTPAQPSAMQGSQATPLVREPPYHIAFCLQDHGEIRSDA